METRGHTWRRWFREVYSFVTFYFMRSIFLFQPSSDGARDIEESIVRFFFWHLYVYSSVRLEYILNPKQLTEKLSKCCGLLYNVMSEIIYQSGKSWIWKPITIPFIIKKTFLLSLKEAVAMVIPWHCLRVSSQIRTLSIAHIVNRKIDI